MNETHETMVEPPVMTAGMYGWRTGRGLVRAATVTDQLRLRQIVDRLFQLEVALADWIAHADASLLDADRFPAVHRALADGLRRGLLAEGARWPSLPGGDVPWASVPWWVDGAQFDAEEVRRCRAAAALDDQEEVAAVDVDD